MNGGFEEIMAQVSPSVQELARGIRALIVGVMPEVVASKHLPELDNT